MDNVTNICEATSQSKDMDNFRPTHRKGKKLLAEKKRRARINNCLMQIRHLVCDGHDESDTDLDKMEKAEILEKTLEVLTRIRHDSSKTTNIMSTRKAMAVRYASGFSLCAEESIRYIQSSRLVPAEVKAQLQNHLRAIAHRMETVIQVDNQDLNNLPQGFSSPSSPLVSSDRLTSVGTLRDDMMNHSQLIDRVSGQLSNISEPGSYYIPSPVHYSTPVHKTSLIAAASLKQEQVSKKSETRLKVNYCQKVESTETSTDRTSYIPMYMNSMDEQSFSSDIESTFHENETRSADSSQVKHCHHSLSSEPSYSQSPVYGHISSVNSTVFLDNSPIPPTTPVLPYHAVYTYHGYEPYPATSSFVIQSTQLRSSPCLLSSAIKRLNAPSNVLDLCVKRTEDQQISPETMWRPW